MLVYKSPYKDFNGRERTEEFYFHLTPAECLELQLSKNGGLDQTIKRIVAAEDTPELIKLFKQVIDLSYGVQSPDGREFYKSPEELAKFKATNAYSDLFMKLATNTTEAANFIKAVIPSDELQKYEKEQTNSDADSEIVKIASV